MESSKRSLSSNQFLFSLFACQQTQSKQPTASKMVPDSKGVEQEQVWHQANNAAVGSELMEQMWCGIVSHKNQKKASLGFELTHSLHHGASVRSKILGWS